MPGDEIRAGVAYDFMVRLTDVDNRPRPKWGVRWNDLKVAYHAVGGLNLTTKAIASSDWVEMGQGLYVLSFSAAELATAGEFEFVITSNPAYATYDDYNGNVYIPLYDTEFIDGVIDSVNVNVVDVQTDMDTVIANLAVVDGNVDTILSRANETRGYLLGRIVWDFVPDPWTITVYDTDNTTLLATFSYTNADTSEERRRL